ncbi:hypothetical protein C2845_PM05G24730 [Panicum miliaceum]|uniref:DUF4220 domain-containing protein n=1 Tax=Panicum miliaceum TaxID=4540 RepID=A0A3L6ST34_PANMI|nr:hypothetical protein C2845_PM05G24730 [Panicum miliaceum]
MACSYTPIHLFDSEELSRHPPPVIHLYPLFHYVSTPVALVLFMAAEKGDRLHTSTTDITVTYILLLGAIVLDVSSATIFMFSYVMRFNNLPTRILLVANYISSTLTQKQWCEELAQYSMIKRYVAQDTRRPARMASIRRCIGSRLLGARFLDITRIPITKDHKEFILDNLLCFGIAKAWNCTSSRGQLALQKRQQDRPDSALYIQEHQEQCRFPYKRAHLARCNRYVLPLGRQLQRQF